MLLQESVGETYQGASFVAFCEEWLALRRAVTKPSTLTRYEQVTRDFIASLPERRRTAEVSSVQAREIREWRDGLMAPGLEQNRLVMLALTIVRSVFNDGRKQGILLTNPAEAVPMLAAVDVDERIPFETPQVQALPSSRRYRVDRHGAIRISRGASHLGLRGFCAGTTRI